MAKLNPSDPIFTDGTTLKAYRQNLVDRLSGQGLDTTKIIASAQAVEAYVVEAADDEREQRRATIERQLGMVGDPVKALAAAKTLDAFINGKAA